jgi:hypothetical protein
LKKRGLKLLACDVPRLFRDLSSLAFQLLFSKYQLMLLVQQLLLLPKKRNVNKQKARQGPKRGHGPLQVTSQLVQVAE